MLIITPLFLDQCDLVIAAVNDMELAEQIRNDAKQKGKLINAADKPSLCDFYLGSVVTKGDIKIAISTNGKSPTLARRLKEFFNEVLPDEIETAVTNLNTIRNNIQSGFKERVKKLNELTASLSDVSLTAFIGNPPAITPTGNTIQNGYYQNCVLIRFTN
jgi:siroheme synthase-like protein